MFIIDRNIGTMSINLQHSFIYKILVVLTVKKNIIKRYHLNNLKYIKKYITPFYLNTNQKNILQNII
jgi:hypothetical protein